MFRAEDEVAARRLVSELGAMDLRAKLVSGTQSTAPAVVRFLDRGRVSILCCGSEPNDRQLEIISDPDPSLLALRTAERLRALGLGAPPPAETFYPAAPLAPPPQAVRRWLTLRAGAGVIAPAPSFGPGATLSFGATLSLAGPLAVSVFGHRAIVSPEHRSAGLWIESTPALFAAGPTYAHESGRLGVQASLLAAFVRSPLRYRVAGDEERGWRRRRGGAGASVVGFWQLIGPLSVVVDLTAVYMFKEPAVRRSSFVEGELFAPLVVGTVGFAWRFADGLGRSTEAVARAR